MELGGLKVRETTQEPLGVPTEKDKTWLPTKIVTGTHPPGPKFRNKTVLLATLNPSVNRKEVQSQGGCRHSSDRLGRHPRHFYVTLQCVVRGRPVGS